MPKKNVSELTSLAAAYWQTRDLQVKEELARKSQPLVRYIALRVSVNKNKLDTLICDGNLGLTISIEKYQFYPGSKFENFAGRKIRWAMIDGFRESSTLDHRTKDRLNLMEKFEDEFRKKYQQPPTYHDYENTWTEKKWPLKSFKEFYFSLILPSLRNEPLAPISKTSTLRNREFITDPESQSLRAEDPYNIAVAKEFLEILRARSLEAAS